MTDSAIETVAEELSPEEQRPEEKPAKTRRWRFNLSGLLFAMLVICVMVGRESNLYRAEKALVISLQKIAREGPEWRREERWEFLARESFREVVRRVSPHLTLRVKSVNIWERHAADRGDSAEPLDQRASLPSNPKAKPSSREERAAADDSRLIAEVDAVLRHGATLNTIEEAIFQSVHWTPKRLRLLRRWTNLRTLALKGGGVDAEALSHISEMDGLVGLALYSNSLASEDLAHLAQLKRLRWLSLERMKFDREAIESLRKSLPKTYVTYMP